ncbi:hypothetical protein GKG47_14135 [Lactonifactor sp. BIOML-A3]|uniref:HNH endonuclease signature motif containing protein n=1 Tax=unclassified Lactonifactor TaxID=2636670 RepID=UPI0012B08924|nr:MULTISPECIES: HNH endonuclease signature motif containing protein [unclassified Lactonifactor]MSA02922.1 hypothetical protein [Lactonifactor sp. BIOML-A5]MSA10281.1 hypothetical protein [Lactonifactor sp. BIOML-A4]MSA13569.1 hypothetical protein [Lactonifactor sp. BIOML-A3]MSA19254.1 hypothetical protein [Lactonifactor sp. BIOML-A2]MSA39123.1 hypothetical protein [Lactonifactor sp. BIOML-A1]
MFTLHTFYKSNEWEGLLQIIKMERLNDKGQLICEYCGRPITAKYDCIGHHRIPLTDDNVNDVYVSLNPEHIQLVHHRCHNKIHNKLGYQMRQVYIVWGSPLSGKTSWVQQNIAPGDLIVDMDSIWQCVSGQPKYVKPNKLKSVVFGLRDELLQMVQYRRGKWNNAYIIGGYPLQMERERLVSLLSAQDIFIDTDMQTCLDRLHCSTDGRNIKEWENYITDWWNKYTPPT